MNNRGLLPSDLHRLADGLANLAKRVRGLEVRDNVPLGTVILYRDSNQSIGSTLASTTAIQWETLKSGLGFTWTLEANTKIFSAGQRAGERFEINGIVRWDTNGTGRREGYLKVYTSAAVLRETIPLHGVGSDAGGNMILPISLPYEWIDPTDYFQIEVVQNSGAPLNLNFARLGVKIVR